MFKYFILLFFAVLSSNLYSQCYIMVSPSITNIEGNLASKTNLYVEIGKQWDAFSFGIDLGKTSLHKDSTLYVEFKPNLNVFQQGKFTNTFTTGIGYVFNADANYLFELSSGVEYTYSKKVHFNFNFGQYYYSGIKNKYDEIFFGTSIMIFINNHIK